MTKNKLMDINANTLAKLQKYEILKTVKMGGGARGSSSSCVKLKQLQQCKRKVKLKSGVLTIYVIMDMVKILLYHDIDLPDNTTCKFQWCV